MPQGRGGTWSAQGVILFGSLSGPIQRVSGGGGAPTAATTLTKEETNHRWPSFLPDGRRFLFTRGALPPLEVEVSAVDSPERTQLLTAASHAVYAEPGYLLFVRERTLLAQRFDSKSARPIGEAFPLAEGVEAEGTGYAPFSASANGVLTYQPGSSRTDFIWFTREGRAIERVEPPEGSDSFDLSPDGRRLAVRARSPQGTDNDVWIYDLVRKTASRFTFDQGDDNFPTWSPDGRQIAFTGPVGDGKVTGILQKDTSGALRPVEVLQPPPGVQILTLWDWSRDNRYLVYLLTDPKTKTGIDIWALSLARERKPIPLVQIDGTQVHAQVSPDGRWLAYSSTESGRFEVYVQDFPVAKQRAQISNAGGVQPHWRGDGKELYYLAANGMITAVSVEGGEAFKAGLPVELFQTRTVGGPMVATRQHFIPSRDGQRFLVRSIPADALTSPYVVVLNWPSASGPAGR